MYIIRFRYALKVPYMKAKGFGNSCIGVDNGISETERGYG